jgi:hypothetical protein
MPPPRRTTFGSPDGSGLTTTTPLLLGSTDDTASMYNTPCHSAETCGVEGTGPPFCTTVEPIDLPARR